MSTTGSAGWCGQPRAATLGWFFDDLGAERTRLLSHVSCDGAEWSVDPGAGERTGAAGGDLPGPFHVVVCAMKALDKVRAHTMARAGISDRHAMWAVPKSPPDMTTEQRTSLAEIAASNATSTARICSKSNCARPFGSTKLEVVPEHSADEYLPAYDSSDAVAVVVEVERETVWEALLEVDLIAVRRKSPMVGMGQCANRRVRPDQPCD